MLAVVVLLGSGLQIFNAHPALYWGESSYNGHPAWLKMSAREGPGEQPLGVTRVLGHDFDTTGVLGVSAGRYGAPIERGFPSWATLPSDQWLAMGRRIHFFFAWILVINGALYVAYGIWSRHLSRDLAPTRGDWRGIGRSIRDHLLLRFPTGEAARRYNVLQKLAYLLVIFGVVPLLVLMGLSMSPWLNSIGAGWVDLFGGRQSARSLHFLAALALVVFVLVHVLEVLISGFWNHLRAMITGDYVIETRPPRGERHEEP